MTTHEQIEVLRAIRKNAARRQTLERKLAETRAEGDTLIVQADAVGVPKLTITRTAKMTRNTIYSILLRAKAAA